MKRIFSVLMVCAIMCSLIVGCGNQQETTVPTTAPQPTQTVAPTTQPTTEPTEPTQPEATDSALAVLETVWNLFAEDEKFWVVGGGYNNMVDNAPGAVEMTDTDFLTYSLLIPETQMSSVTEAASMMHAMNANNFTCGVYKVEDINAFADAMRDVILNNQWICGMPELLKIADLGNGYVIVAFGIGDAMNPFFQNVAAAYPEATMLAEETIA